jgi:hypothetical protein
VLFACLAVILAGAILEAVAFVTVSVNEGRIFSFRAMRLRQLDTGDPAETAAAQTGAGFEVVHPYVGFVIDPRGQSAHAANYRAAMRRCCGVGVNEFGFLDDKEPIQPRDPTRVIVGITGGSVAFWVSVQAQEELVAELERAPLFRNRSIVLVRLAAGGYKQPQQLQILAYLLSLGAHFDLLINLDGFNEVALPPVENLPQQVFPFFPRNWAARTNATPDRDYLRAVARLSALSERRSTAARWMLSSPARWSVLANSVWLYYDRRLAAQGLAEQETVRRGAEGEAAYVTTGPRWRDGSDGELYARLADVWRRSSLQMHGLATANGFKYVHALQPNQYVRGSKLLSDEERRTAYRESQPYRIGVESGYDDLIRAGEELLRNGVAFVDLTQMFRGSRETLYVDDCCHLSPDGNRMLARAIGRAVVEAMGR